MQDTEVISAAKFLKKKNELSDDEKIIMAQFKNIQMMRKENCPPHIQRQYDILKAKLDALKS